MPVVCAFSGPGQLQEERYVRQFVTEGPVVRKRLITRAYQQLPGTSVRYVQPIRGDTAESLQQHKQQQVLHQYTVQQQHGSRQGVVPAGVQSVQVSGGPGYQVSAPGVQVRQVQLPAEVQQQGSVTTVVKETRSGGLGGGQTTQTTTTRTVKEMPASTLEGGVVVIEESLPGGGTEEHRTMQETRTVTQSYQGIPVTQHSYQLMQQSMPVTTQHQQQQSYHITTQQQQSMPSVTQHQQGGVTVVKQQVVRGGSSEGAASGTMRRGFQQVEMVEGLSTEELSKQMERMIGDPMAGEMIYLFLCYWLVESLVVSINTASTSSHYHYYTYCNSL